LTLIQSISQSIHAVNGPINEPGIDRVQALADVSRSVYVVIATKPVHRLQIRPIVHN